jgi:hypothetical protein
MHIGKPARVKIAVPHMPVKFYEAIEVVRPVNIAGWAGPQDGPDG